MRFKLILLIFFIHILPIFAIEEDEILLDENIEPQKTENIRGYIQQSPYLLGDYKGLRTKLQENGIDIQSSYMINSFAMRNRQKRISKGTYQGLFNLSLDLDSEKMNLFKGGKLHVLYQVGNKGLGSKDFMNTYSDISSYNPSKSINQISELYYEQSIKDDLVNLKIGKQDANMDFQALENGFEFLNVSFSFIENTPMPLYPSQQMGVRARLKLPKEIYFQNGFYDGNSKIGATPKSFFTGENDYFNITEVYKLTDFKQKKGKYLIGDWIKTSDKTNYGIYAGFEQKLSNRFNDKSGGLSAFGQFGYARNSINDAPYYYGIGLVFKGISENRKNDSIGAAFGLNQFNKTLHKIENKNIEHTIELFYKIKLTEFLYVQPDIQYIIKPSGTEKNAFALGVRSCVIF